MVESRCGLLCSSCAFREPHGCGGCIETNGNPFYGECPIAQCCQTKGFEHCGGCSEIPCDGLYEYSYSDDEHGDKPPGLRIAAVRKWAAESGRQTWKNVLLTDSGWNGSFERFDESTVNRNVLNKFYKMLGKPPEQAKVLFIPTAANNNEARLYAGGCFAELLCAGILPNNIRVYDIDGTLTAEQAMEFDAVYVTGGDTGYLLERVKTTGFDKIIKKMVYAGKVYVGVSAGSMIATPNIGSPGAKETAGLCLLNAFITVHCPKGTEPKIDLPLPHIPLNMGQALAVNWSGYELIER